jgi:hypothetical protein
MPDARPAPAKQPDDASGDMVNGSVGVLATEHAPGGAMKH